jgi:hypothetical protein
MTARVRRIFMLTGLVVALGALFAPSALTVVREDPPKALPTLYVQYTMNCTFSIIDDFGRRVSSITPGTYQIEVSTPIMFKLVRPGGVGVDDIAPNDFTGCKGWVQFHLTGPGVDLFTTLDSGCDAFLLLPAQTFRAGANYTFQDLNQPAATRTTLPVESAGSAPTPVSPYTATSGKGDTSVDLVGSRRMPILAELNATLGKQGALSLKTRKGQDVLNLKAGKYRFVVRDESSKSGFILEPVTAGKPKSLSSAKFVGKASKGVVLSVGRWMYRSASGATHYFLVTR